MRAMALTLFPSVSPTHSCSCLVLPWATGPEASRWDGLATTATLISLFVTRFSRWWDIPRWYFTSPDPSSSSLSLESNWQKMFSNGFLQTLASTLSLPLKQNRKLWWELTYPQMYQSQACNYKFTSTEPFEFPYSLPLINFCLKFNQIVIRTYEAFQWWSSPPQTLSIYQWQSSFLGSKPHIPPNQISSRRST